MPLILTLRKPNNQGGETLLRTDRGEVVLGRSPDVTVVLADPSVSRRHCTISGQDAQWRIADTSSGGTLLNGLRLTGPQMLRHGDVIGLGASEIAVGLEPEAAVARESWTRPASAAGWTTAPAPLAPQTSPAAQDGALSAAVSALTRLAQDRRQARAELGVARPGEPDLPAAQDLARQLAAATPAQATALIETLYREIDAHQRAVLGAMQAGLHAALDQFAPEAIKHRARSDAEAWKAYEKAFAARDGFVEIFAQALARHYAAQVA